MKKIIGFIIFILMFVLLLLAINVSAEGTTTTIGYLTFKEHDTYCEVTACSTSATGSIDIPSSVVFDGNSIPVTSIDNYAFSGCSGFTSITIPDSVTSIGKDAFYNCSNLTKVYISDITSWCDINFSNGYSNPLYYAHNLYLDGNLVTDLVIPDGVTSIDYAFYRCRCLTSVTIPNSVTSIGYGAFYQCYDLTSVTMPDNLTSIGNYAFEACTSLENIDISNSVTSIGIRAFRACSKLKNIVIPDSVKFIGVSAFSDCTKLINITMSNEIMSIGDGAFSGCSSLKCNEYGNGLYIGNNDNKYLVLMKVKDTSSGSYGFNSNVRIIYSYSGHKWMSSISIPNGVVSIGASAFSESNSLTNVTLPNTVIEIGKRAFWKCSKLKSINIPDSITTIGALAFEGCNALSEVHITDLAHWCGLHFSNDPYSYNSTVIYSLNNPLCYSRHLYLNGEKVRSLIIPDDVTEIHDYVFYNGYDINRIVIPHNVQSIGKEAFYGCSGISKAYYIGTEEQWNENVIVNEGNDALINKLVFHPEHAYGDWIIDVAATQESDGHKHRVCSECGFEQDENISSSFEFSKISVTLQSSLAINFKANKALFEDIGYENPYVVFEFNGKQTVVTDYVVDGDKYVFSFSDIAPDKMNDTIKAKLYATYGGIEYSSDEASYSIAAYCYALLGNTTDAKLRTLLVDLLHYGAATQAYTGYKTDELADKELTAEQLAWGTQTNPVLTKITDAHFADVPNPEVSWKSAGLSLNEAITLRLTFAADDTADVVIIIKDENDVTLGEIEAFTASGGRFTARFDGLNAGQMKEKLFITAYRNNQPISNTLLYSVESYAYSKKNGADANLAALVKALMKYGNSAYAYVH